VGGNRSVSFKLTDLKYRVGGIVDYDFLDKAILFKGKDLKNRNLVKGGEFVGGEAPKQNYGQVKPKA